jgi:hypothetical protein
VALPAGPHLLTVGDGSHGGPTQLTIGPGADLSHHLQVAPAPVARTGRLHIVAEPAGSRISVDGRPQGVSSATVDGLEPGEHVVLVQTPTGETRRRSVTVESGGTMSLVVAAVAAVDSKMPVAGWVKIMAGVDLQVFDREQLVGTTAADRIMLTAGRHELDLVNQALGVRERRAVEIKPGEMTVVNMALPSGTLHINALPWAEVWIDGQRVGDTPLANVRVPIGSHQLVFRHPQLGERKQTVAVPADRPVRVGVDLGSS